MIPPAALFGYSTSGAVLTLALPLGLFIVVMIAVYLVFSRRHTVPGRGPVGDAKPVPPPPQAARDAAAATGFPTAASSGGAEPLAGRATPPRAGALHEDRPASDDDTEVSDTAVGGTAASDTAVGPAPPGGTEAGGTAASDTAVGPAPPGQTEADGAAAGDRAGDGPAPGGQPAGPG